MKILLFTHTAAKIGNISPAYILTTNKEIPLVINMNYGAHENFSLRFYGDDGVVYEAKPLESFAFTEGMEVREPDDDIPLRSYRPVSRSLEYTPTKHKPGLEELDLGNVKLFASLDEVDESIDLFVVATSCEPRLSIYRQCLDRNPRYIILDKYLFKSREEFEECLTLIRVPTFVNQWMYGSKTFDPLFEEQARSVELTGSGWGLACNAAHWIDVFKRHMNITHLQVGSDTTISKVFPSKRAGYKEIYGELVFVDKESDRTFRLIDNGDASLVGGQEIKVDNRAYWFDYSTILLGGKVLSNFTYFSDLIGDITGDILRTGECQLPCLEESISQHQLIEDILENLDHRPKIT